MKSKCLSKFRSNIYSLFLLLFVTVLSVFVLAEDEEKAIQDSIQEKQIETFENASQSQQRVENLDDEKAELFAEYRQVVLEFDQLKNYDDQLQRLIQSHEIAITDTQLQLQQLESTKQTIVPLTNRMVDALDKFVKFDLPFLLQERRFRVENLQQLIERADTSLPEKYRRIMEAYQIEMDYGRTIDAYEGDIEFENEILKVEILRIGRVGLYFLALDGKRAGQFDVQQKRWLPLDNSLRSNVRVGIEVARKQTPPDLLTLPIPVASLGGGR